MVFVTPWSVPQMLTFSSVMAARTAGDPAGVCVATIAGRIVNYNATFAEMVGYANEELKDRELRDVLERAAALDEIRRKLEDTPTVRGQEIELRISTMPTALSEARIVLYLAAFFGVSGIWRRGSICVSGNRNFRISNPSLGSLMLPPSVPR